MPKYVISWMKEIREYGILNMPHIFLPNSSPPHLLVSYCVELCWFVHIWKSCVFLCHIFVDLKPPDVR